MTAGTHTHQVRWVASGAALFDRLAMMNMLGDREAPVAVSVDVSHSGSRNSCSRLLIFQALLL